MNRYLLDTNICIYYIKGLYNLDQKIERAGKGNCVISEITVAELKYGIENSKTPESMRTVVQSLIDTLPIIPIYNALDVYAVQKASLRRRGLLIDDFDILIGATAITHNLIMVTRNVDHLNRLDGVIIEDWTVAK